MRKYFTSLLLFFLPAIISAQKITSISDTSVHASFRGLSVVTDDLFWVSGTKGTVGKSEDGGKTFQWHILEGFENTDFRSLYAFDKKNAVIASAGTPAVILTTRDGGLSWDQRFRSDDSLMFFDGIDFWDNDHGIIFGDPVDGKMVVMETGDGGKTWNAIPPANCPQPEKGEAAFAASGTTIRTVPGGEVWIATGGAKSRMWHSTDYGQHWKGFDTPIVQGKSSQGIFSFAIVRSNSLLIVGGDYMQDTLRDSTAFFSFDDAKTWKKFALNFPGGYRSCVENCGDNLFICTGTTGTDLFKEGKWQSLSSGGYNCVRKARRGKAVYFCGAKGAIGKLE